MRWISTICIRYLITKPWRNWRLYHVSSLTFLTGRCLFVLFIWKSYLSWHFVLNDQWFFPISVRKPSSQSLSSYFSLGICCSWASDFNPKIPSSSYYNKKAHYLIQAQLSPPRRLNELKNENIIFNGFSVYFLHWKWIITIGS